MVKTGDKPPKRPPPNPIAKPPVGTSREGTTRGDASKRSSGGSDGSQKSLNVPQTPPVCKKSSGGSDTSPKPSNAAKTPPPTKPKPKRSPLPPRRGADSSSGGGAASGSKRSAVVPAGQSDADGASDGLTSGKSRVVTPPVGGGRRARSSKPDSSSSLKSATCDSFGTVDTIITIDSDSTGTENAADTVIEISDALDDPAKAQSRESLAVNIDDDQIDVKDKRKAEIVLNTDTDKDLIKFDNDDSLDTGKGIDYTHQQTHAYRPPGEMLKIDLDEIVERDEAIEIEPVGGTPRLPGDGRNENAPKSPIVSPKEAKREGSAPKSPSISPTNAKKEGPINNTESASPQMPSANDVNTQRKGNVPSQSNSPSPLQPASQEQSSSKVTCQEQSHSQPPANMSTAPANSATVSKLEINNEQKKSDKNGLDKSVDLKGSLSEKEKVTLGNNATKANTGPSGNKKDAPKSKPVSKAPAGTSEKEGASKEKTPSKDIKDNKEDKEAVPNGQKSAKAGAADKKDDKTKTNEDKAKTNSKVTATSDEKSKANNKSESGDGKPGPTSSKTPATKSANKATTGQTKASAPRPGPLGKSMKSPEIITTELTPEPARTKKSAKENWLFLKNKRKEYVQMHSPRSGRSRKGISRKESLCVPGKDGDRPGSAAGSPRSLRRGSSKSIDSRMSAIDFSKIAAEVHADLKDDGKDTAGELNVTGTSDNFIKDAIPYLPIPVAVMLLMLNIVAPGIGTMLSGFCTLCCGRPRVHTKDNHVMLSVCINVWVGLAQLFTVSFMLVGWVWSLCWGIYLVILSAEYARIRGIEDQKEEKAHRQKELQAKALTALNGQIRPWTLRT